MEDLGIKLVLILVFSIICISYPLGIEEVAKKKSRTWAS